MNAIQTKRSKELKLIFQISAFRNLIKTQLRNHSVPYSLGDRTGIHLALATDSSKYLTEKLLQLLRNTTENTHKKTQNKQKNPQPPQKKTKNQTKKSPNKQTPTKNYFLKYKLSLYSGIFKISKPDALF